LRDVEFRMAVVDGLWQALSILHTRHSMSSRDSCSLHTSYVLMLLVGVLSGPTLGVLGDGVFRTSAVALALARAGATWSFSSATRPSSFSSISAGSSIPCPRSALVIASGGGPWEWPEWEVASSPVREVGAPFAPRLRTETDGMHSLFSRRHLSTTVRPASKHYKRGVPGLLCEVPFTAFLTPRPDQTAALGLGAAAAGLSIRGRSGYHGHCRSAFNAVHDIERVRDSLRVARCSALRGEGIRIYPGRKPGPLRQLLGLFGAPATVLLIHRHLFLALQSRIPAPGSTSG
jgi:hypothetical protein